ncbi:MAG: sulfatase [Acidobacteria bacterium]|nr:sulfatase [Acidobacteriota bacterium]
MRSKDGMRMTRVTLGAMLLLLLAGPATWKAQSDASLLPEKPNIVFILTDDQRWDSATMSDGGREVMPNLRQELISDGVLFSNAFVSTPLCCPDRASLLAGGYYAHNTGVLTNELPNGGFEKFVDRDSLAVRLRQAGYETALVGKYINKYALTDAYVPPGWSSFAALHQMRSWFDYDVVLGNGTPDEPVHGSVVVSSQYLTRYLAQRATDFIESSSGEAPFFLYYAPVAPHEPATPAPGDENVFADFAYKGRSAGEGDLTDKPRYVRDLAKTYDATQIELFARQQIRSLQSVDRSIAAIVNAVRRKGLLEETVFIFTSDNGYLWGEHRLSGKAYPYEESIHVPLVIRMPGVTPRVEDKPVVTNVDIGATISDLAGLNRVTDGISLRPLLEDPSTAWRTEFLIQGFGDLRWSGMRGSYGGRVWKYVEHASGERELYDLKADPFERSSRHKQTNKTVREVIKSFSAKVAAARGLTVLDSLLPDAQGGATYAYPMSIWGGRAPFHWSVVEGQLPPGLALDPSTGLIKGAPMPGPGGARFRLRVEDSSTSAYSGLPQSYEQWLNLAVRDPQSAQHVAPAMGIDMSSDQQ